MRERRGGGDRRQRLGRRRIDLWASLGKLAGLVASITGAVVGQAELIGEPYRHYVTVTFVACTAAFGFLLGPQHFQRLRDGLRRGR